MRYFTGVLLVALFFSPSLFAQTESATLSGRVTDAQGAAIVGAEVVATDTDTNGKITTKTNGSGIYIFPNLSPAPYRLTVRASGFATAVREGLVLHIQDRVEQNLALRIGSVDEMVTVTAEASLINTTDGSVSTVVDQSYIKNMPLNGRSFQDLILLTPGTVTQSPQTLSINGLFNSSLGSSGEFSVNGQRTESNYYTVDGVSANIGAGTGSDMLLGAGASGSLPGATALGTTQGLVSVDDLQEFRVQSSTYSAEYGRNPGGQFAFETKSGTNQWHGSGYDYVRNSVFDAQDWFNDYFGTLEPTLRQNDFGGTLGGPVRIPGLYNGKDRSFFFFSYEGLRVSQPQATVANIVPDLCLRGVKCPSGGSETPAPPELQPLLNAFPLPSPNGASFGGGAQEIASWFTPASIDSASIKFDQIVNNKHDLFFRFSDTSSDSETRGVFGFNPASDTTQAYLTRTYTAGASSTLANNLSNEFRLNYSSNVVTSSTVINSFGGNTPVDLAQMIGSAAGAQVQSFLFIGGVALIRQISSAGSQHQWNFVDTVALSRGRHRLKFGADYRRLSPTAVQGPPLFQYLYFGASFLEGNLASDGVNVTSPAYPLNTNFSAFAQDEWKLSQRLNLSMGLRWDVNPAPGVTRGLKPYTIAGSGPNTWTLAPQGTPLWQTSWYNFAPRLGVAYTVRDTHGWETVARAGGGVFFDTGQQEGASGFFYGPGFSAASGAFQSGFPSHPAIPVITQPAGPPYGSLFGYAPHLQLPYTIEWNASVQQALGASQSLTFSYVGSHGSRLLQNSVVNTPNNPNAGQVQLIKNGLTSDYHSFQAQFQRRLSRGLTALASYTLAHCLDYGSQNYFIGYQRSNCDMDVRHNFSVAFSYDLPNIGQGVIANALLHHWGLDDRLTTRTGFPVTLTGTPSFDPVTNQQFYAGLDLTGQPIYIYGSHCTDVYAAEFGATLPCPAGRAVNPDAFAQVPTDQNGVPLRAGTAPRNFVRGAGALQVDLAIRREFPIFERLKIQFRAEAFNILNHPNFGTIDSFLGDATFGQFKGTLASGLGVLSPLYQMGGPRSVQFALKLTF